MSGRDFPDSEAIRAPANVLSVDLEEYFQVSNFEAAVPRSTWTSYRSRAADQVGRVLDLLAAHDARATFFVLGWTAERHPALVRQVARAGHEIASHGYWHRLLYEETPTSFRADVRRARAVLEDIVGQAVVGYRAPSFTIVERTRWALDVLADEGFQYDSSIFPVYHDRYGVPGAPHHPYAVRTGGGEIFELPPLTRAWRGGRLPAGGGGYLRLLPVSWTLDALREMNAAGHPATLYLHPWELDFDQPTIAGTRRRDRLRHFVGMRSLPAKLATLLSSARFDTASAVLEGLLEPSAAPQRVAA